MPSRLRPVTQRTLGRRPAHRRRRSDGMHLMRRRPEPADVVIIGAGASGATAAKVLTEAGVNVVCLERGPWMKPDEFSGDELKHVNRFFLWQDLELKPRTKRREAGERAEITRFSPVPQMVGGGTVHYS